MKEELQVNRIDLQENISLESCLKNIGDFKASFFSQWVKCPKTIKIPFYISTINLKIDTPQA